MPEFTRSREGIRYAFGGLRTSQVPDALPPDKSPAAINIRGYRNSSVQSRPGQSLRLDTHALTAKTITDISSYAALYTDNLPRALVRDAQDRIWLTPTSGTDGVQVGTLVGAGSSPGVSMIPFRPNASPNPFMYIANNSDYQKFPAPSGDVSTPSNVGIAEPPTAPVAALQPILNSSGAPMTETLRPTAFTNPTAIPGYGADQPWTNPGDAIDGNPNTYAYGDADNGPSNNEASCLWYGFPAASFSYSNLKLLIDIEATASGIPHTEPRFLIAINHSLDGGVTWNPYTYYVSLALPPGTISRFALPVALSPSTDLTQLQVRAYIAANPVTPLQQSGQFRIYDISTEGSNTVGFFDQTGDAADWTEGGTAAAPSDSVGPGDNALAVIPDSINPNIYSIGFEFVSSPPAPWQTGQTMTQGANPFLVLDVMQPSITANIAAIYYFSGSTGRCVIVPANLPFSGAPQYNGTNIKSPGFLQPSAIAGLRRGAVLKLGTGGGVEYVYVDAVTVGPDNTICIETSTVATHAVDEDLFAMPTMIVYGSVAPTPGGNNLNSDLIESDIASGVGYLTRTVDFFDIVYSASGLQSADYLHCSLYIDTPENLTDITILFDIGDGSFTQDFYYYVVRASDLSNFLAGDVTQISAAQTAAQRAMIDAEIANMAGDRGSTLSGGQLAPGLGQRTEILIPIASLTRVGTGTQTLIDTNSVRIQVNCTGDVTLRYGNLSTWGGAQCDVGLQGSPYFYRVRPRSKATGVVGNPSPATRYGVNPLRFQVLLQLPDASYDSQIDTWDIFRYGGSVTSWRYIGSTPTGNQTFTDNYSDDAALAGDALDFDNFQPWPSIDLPLNLPDGSASVVGTTAVVSTNHTEILYYLPGTLVQLGGVNVFTLWTRPILISAGVYLLQFVENAGALNNASVNIQEPIIAQRRLPYLWGPDAGGTIFACGDQLRPGTLSFAKNYAPDSAPDSYNLEIVEPGEPLLGGEILDGLSFVASSERWWALYPTPENPAQRYNPVQQPFTRGLAAPFGHCNDGQAFYWWAKDGIYASTKGSLTDADLYNLFPHEGVVGREVTYGAYTFMPPDYSRAGTFRLTWTNSYLYALYQDTSGVYHCLVLNTLTGAWSEDIYSPRVSAMFHPAQPAGTLQTSTARYDELLMGTVDGRVAAQQEGSNDLDGPIACVLATFEYPGEDIRAPKQWGDFYMDLTPNAAAGITVQPYSSGASVAPAVIIPQSTRIQRAASVSGIVVSQFLGLLATWTDDFDTQSLPSQLHIWQPSFAVQPARTLAFTTFGTSYGITGFMHIQQLAIAYVSNDPITITITSYDGQSPAPLVIPSTGGAYKKTIFQLTPNKGQLYRFAWSASTEFQVFLDDCEIHVGEWGRLGPYSVRKDMGGIVSAGAAI